MGLAESLSQVAKPNKSQCTLGKIITNLPDAEKSALVEAIDSTMLAADIIRALQMNGYRISGNTTRDHRKKKCACYWESK